MKPSRPLVVPDFLVWELDTRLYLNGTTEYETWSEVAGQRFGIIMAYNPGVPDNSSRVHHLGNYQFQRDRTCDFMATMVTYDESKPIGKELISTSRRWSHKQPLVHDAFTDVSNGLIVV